MPDAQTQPTPPPSEVSAEQSTPAETSKPKKKTLKEVTAELEDLTEVATKRTTTIRDLRIQEQQAIDILRRQPSPGVSMAQELFDRNNALDDLRKLFKVVI